MNAVLKQPSSPKSLDQAFVDSQQLPVEKRGTTFEALFYRQLQQVTARIHETDNVEQIMLATARRPSQRLCQWHVSLSISSVRGILYCRYFEYFRLSFSSNC